MMKLLLHICCAPCVIYPFQELSAKDNFLIKAFFYNPNIHPYSEYILRRRSLEEFSQKSNLAVVYYRYDMENFFRRIAFKETRLKRCPICWRMRLEETARFGQENGFDFFSTTLLISPYQNHELIKEIGEDIAKERGIKFYYRDWKDGFYHSQSEARRHNLYRQKYCGCIYSEKERYTNKSNIKNQISKLHTKNQKF